MARPSLAYVLSVAVGAWAFRAVQLWQQGDAPVRAIAESAATLVGLGPIYLGALAVLLVPALVVTIEVVHRFEVDSRARRAVVGAFSFGGWCLFGAIALAVFSRVVLVPEWLVGAIAVFVVAGGAFSLLAFDGLDVRRRQRIDGSGAGRRRVRHPRQHLDGRALGRDRLTSFR
jgi:hypothetical protein